MGWGGGRKSSSRPRETLTQYSYRANSRPGVGCGTPTDRGELIGPRAVERQACAIGHGRAIEQRDVSRHDCGDKAPLDTAAQQNFRVHLWIQVRARIMARVGRGLGHEPFLVASPVHQQLARQHEAIQAAAAVHRKNCLQYSSTFGAQQARPLKRKNRATTTSAAPLKARLTEATLASSHPHRPEGSGVRCGLLTHAGVCALFLICAPRLGVVQQTGGTPTGRGSSSSDLCRRLVLFSTVVLASCTMYD